MDEPTADQIELAGRVMDFCRGKDPAPGVTDIAEALETDNAQIIDILDAFGVEGGKATYKGPGQGGGWVPEPEPTELSSEHVGFRHPDGSLQEQPFVPEEVPGEEES